MRGREVEYVFLIGAARSGTKFLRDVLGSSGDVAFVPFDINYVWRYGEEWRSDDVIPEEAANRRRREYIQHAILRFSKASTGMPRKVLEKTVSNCFRVPYVFRMFPDARFIHLVRDGRDVAESAARMWQAGPDVQRLIEKAKSFPIRHYRYAVWFMVNRMRAAKRQGQRRSIWGPRYPDLEGDLESSSIVELAAKQWEQSVRFARQGLSCVPDDQKITVRYEDLLSDERVFEDVLNLLRLPDRDCVLRVFKSSMRRGLGGKWRMLARREQVRIETIQSEMLSAFGYAPRLEKDD